MSTGLPSVATDHYGHDREQKNDMNTTSNRQINSNVSFGKTALKIISVRCSRMLKISPIVKLHLDKFVCRGKSRHRYSNRKFIFVELFYFHLFIHFNCLGGIYLALRRDRRAIQIEYLQNKISPPGIRVISSNQQL